MVLLLGGAGGIGSATAERFAAEEARVVIADVNGAKASALAAQLSAHGAPVTATTVDVRNAGDVDRVVDFTVERYGRLDVLFNCAGNAIRRPLLEHTSEQYDEVVRVHQYGTFHGIRSAARVMHVTRTRGCIINTSSVLGYIAASGLIGYSAAKAAIRSMTQAAALELAPLGIRVVGIAPGGVDTDLMADPADPNATRTIARGHLRRRLVSPGRVADVVLFLASPEADAINGSVVVIDDGYLSFK